MYKRLDTFVNEQESYAGFNRVFTLPTPLPFSPAVIVLSCKNGEEITRLEIAANRNDAILNHVSWKIVREGLGYSTERDWALEPSTGLQSNFVEGR